MIIIYMMINTKETSNAIAKTISKILFNFSFSNNRIVIILSIFFNKFKIDCDNLIKQIKITLKVKVIIMESKPNRGVAKEYSKSHLMQLLAAIIFFIIWITDSFIFMFSTIFESYIPFLIRIIIFLALLTIGLLLILKTGHILFHKENVTFKLIKTGIFSYTRHPLYLGVLILYLGFIILSFSLISIIGFIIVFIIYDRIATFEEYELEKEFKKEYIEYKKQVPKWIPLIIKR